MDSPVVFIQVHSGLYLSTELSGGQGPLARPVTIDRVAWFPEELPLGDLDQFCIQVCACGENRNL